MRNFTIASQDIGLINNVKEGLKAAVLTLIEPKHLNHVEALLTCWFVCRHLAFFMLESIVF